MRLLKDDLRELDLFSEASRSELDVIGKQLTRLKVKAGRGPRCVRVPSATSS